MSWFAIVWLAIGAFYLGRWCGWREGYDAAVRRHERFDLMVEADGDAISRTP